ncbi:4Fe-4S dicluster domain-containing protein, partial [bacterium]|nr:4Fe-4S dicluster domain-containing protein [bacterium]
MIKQKKINNLLNVIHKEYGIFAPILDGKELFISKISDIKDIDYSGRIPLNSWKYLFFPPCEDIFEVNKDDFQEIKHDYPKVCAYNMTVLDLKALGLYDLVFKDDPYYLKRRRNTLVVGYFASSPEKKDFKDWTNYATSFYENTLEHIPFDIFIMRSKAGNFKVYSGSYKGQDILEKAKIKEFSNVKFVGLIPEEGPDKRMLELYDVIKNSKDDKLWDELGKICIACGKCSQVCPTCFCFDLEDEPQNNSIIRKRSCSNCFHPEFTELAGGASYTGSVKEKLIFWYEHKFVRIPKEYNVPGCVGCNRCSEVCPVLINI